MGECSKYLLRGRANWGWEGVIVDYHIGSKGFFFLAKLSSKLGLETPN